MDSPRFFGRESMTVIKVFALVSALASVAVLAQPAGVPATPEAPCQDNPGTDEVSIPSDSGFVGIFNGVDLKGWWNNCHGEDANGSNATKGGVYKVDPAIKAMYTQQRATAPGGSALCTNKKYGNQEIIVEYWADWGNDAGLYHRTTEKAEAIQTVIDYKPNNCVGGSYPQEMEGLGNSFYNCSYKFGGSETGAFSGTQGNAGPIDKAALVPADMYDVNGWNELRVKIFGNPAHHQAWMRKLGGSKWVQTLDVTWPSYYLAPAGVLAQTGYTAIQIHGNGYWNKTVLGNWYRNIRVRELDNTGKPLNTVAIKTKLNSQIKVSMNAKGLQGWLDRDYTVKVTDINGKVSDSFKASAGNFSHGISHALPKGIAFVHLSAGTVSGVIRIIPL
jgi:hypothetical protein